MTGTTMPATPAPLRWALVGTGAVSRSIASDLSRIGPVNRLTVCSRSPERGAEFARPLGIDHISSFEEMLEDDAIDIAYIGTPHATHSALAIRALEAGKHVLIEKPLGISAHDVARVATAAKAAGRFAMEGMWMKFSPAYQSLIADARQGTIGELTAIRAWFGLPFGESDSAVWSAERRSSTLLDQGIYPVTLAQDLFGQPTTINAHAVVRPDGVDLTVHAALTYEQGQFAQMAASMVGFLEPTASISGTAGWLSVPAPFWATDRYRRHIGEIAGALFAPDDVVFDREGDGYVPMLRAVELAIHDGLVEHPLHPISASLGLATTLDRIIASATHQENE